MENIKLSKYSYFIFIAILIFSYLFNLYIEIGYVRVFLLSLFLIGIYIYIYYFSKIKNIYSVNKLNSKTQIIFKSIYLIIVMAVVILDILKNNIMGAGVGLLLFFMAIDIKTTIFYNDDIIINNWKIYYIKDCNFTSKVIDRFYYKCIYIDIEKEYHIIKILNRDFETLKRILQ